METETGRAWLFAPGERIVDWTVLARLGRGGMGEVYAVTEGDCADAPIFALKIFRASGKDADFLRRRFRDMAATLLAVAHPHVVKVLRMGEVPTAEGAAPFTLMALVGVAPETREAALKDPATLPESATPPPGAVPVALSAADLLEAPNGLPEALLERMWRDAEAALRHLHARGIVHGDIKPGNLLLSAGGHVTVVDFGMARVRNGAPRPAGYETTVTELRSLVRGTPEYLAPELLRGGAPTPAGDLYALGATFFLLRTGVAYTGSPAERLLVEDGVGKRWQARFRATLAADPATRHWPRVSGLGSRRRFLAAGLGAGAALVAAGAAWWAWRRVGGGAAAGWARGEAVHLGIGEHVEVGLPPATRLPAISLARRARLAFRMQGQTWRLGEIVADEAATLALEGPGKLAVVDAAKARFAGTLALAGGAEADIVNRVGGSPRLAIGAGCAVAFIPRGNRWASVMFRAIDLSGGGKFAVQGLRLYLNWRERAPVLMGDGAVFEGFNVIGGAVFRATRGAATLRGELYLWDTLTLSADAGATLALGGKLFMYDYWKRGMIVVAKDNAGDIVLEQEPFLPLCAVALRAGRTTLRAQAVQDTARNWCANKTCHNWELWAGATLRGTGGVVFSLKTCLAARAGALLEGGEEGRGALTLSRARLEADAIVVARGGCVAVGALEARGAVRVRIAPDAAPGPVLTWETLDGTPDFRAENLPAGRALRRDPNALVLT